MEKEKTFKLCMVEGDGWAHVLCAYFATADAKDVIGDDWDDRPYEHNAGSPYTRDCNGKEIEVKELYFSLPYYDIKTPASGYMNSPYSVEEINTGAIAWVWNNDFKIFANTPLDEFIRIIKEQDGKIFEEIE